MYVNIVYWRQLINGKICKNIVNQGQIKVELPKIRNPTKKRDEDDRLGIKLPAEERNNPRRTPSPISHENLLQGCDQPKTFMRLIDSLSRHIILGNTTYPQHVLNSSTPHSSEIKEVYV